MRAIERGELLARRDNRNQWQIDPDALAHWAHNEHAQEDAHEAPTQDPKLQIAVLEERIRGLEALLVEMRHDRDAWKSIAQRPWWKRLAG